MNKFIYDAMKSSYTAYHAADNAAAFLADNGYEELFEHEEMRIKRGGKYFVRRGGSSLIAFKIGDLSYYNYKIVASHLDSPALKLKYSPVVKACGVSKLNVETYGGGIISSYLDIPLKIAGRIYVRKGDRIEGETYTDPHLYIIPNAAIHMNRALNDGYKYNPQTDLMPLFGLDADEDYFSHLGQSKKTVGYDLFAVNAAQPFFAGVNDEFFCAPRIDDQICAFASLAALADCNPEGVAVAFLADNEEVGSRTAEGADSDFLRKTLETVNRSLGMDAADFGRAVACSVTVSADNAHAAHPDYPHLSDPTNATVLGGGIVIKHHANKNYTTDGLSSALFEEIMKAAGVKTQHFFMRSDLRCGSTLGTLSLSQLAMESVDIGVAQLAMHSATETICASDADAMTDGLKAFYSARYKRTSNGYKLK